MSSYTFGQKAFTPVPPDKGSFPLDHEGLCKKLMIKYMKCLRTNDNDNSFCREEARDYLACRMDNNLMTREDWSKLGMVNLLIGCTSSVATIKLPVLIRDLLEQNSFNVEIQVITTERARHFFTKEELPENVVLYTDEDEWKTWTKRGDPIIHIDLGKWADIFVIAPLDANTLAKIAN
ncbi:hypothetical protein ILUMI_09129, partial [Ignelater luminosus]